MVRHSKERALSDREFERLLQGVESISEPWYRTSTRFIVLVAGRLGLRAGEIAHMDESWVDFRRGILSVPAHEPCTKGSDGGPCGYCRSLAKSVVKHGVPSEETARLELLNQGQLIDLGYAYQELRAGYQAYTEGMIGDEELSDRIHDTLSMAEENGHDAWKKWESLEDRANRYIDRRDVTLEEALSEYWIPKTDAAARQIPFDFSTRVELAIEDFFDYVDRYPTSRTTVNTRVDEALEAAGFDKLDTSPHGLRATAASYHAGRGLSTLGLQSMFGWVQIETANKYVTSSGVNTQRELHSIH